MQLARSLLVGAALLAHAGATELTAETWDEAVSGKTVFVKFLAPWCGHCKRMKPDWDKLMKKFDGHKDVVIADVDCTAGGKSLCEKMGVQGYPTIKYGDPDDLQDYQGGREFKAMKKFAKTLGPSCGPAHLELCDEEKKTKIDELKALGETERAALIKEQEDSMAKVEADFKSFVEGLQKSYEEANKKKDAELQAIKDGGLGLLKSVHAFEKKAKSEL